MLTFAELIITKKDGNFSMYLSKGKCKRIWKDHSIMSKTISFDVVKRRCSRTRTNPE